MDLSVRNFRRLTSADVSVSPIALVCGPNEAGKTSLVEAAMAALLQTGTPRPGAKKKDGALMVRRGADKGEIILSDTDGKVAVTFPKCAVSASGDRPPRASAFAAGAMSLVDLPPDQRATALSGYIDATPGLTDLAGRMAELGYADSAVEKTWQAIEKDGWDAMTKQVAEHATRLKGKWEAAADEAYGAKKADDWKPAGWSDDLADATDDDLADAVAEAKDRLEGMIGTAAVSQAERERLAEAAGSDPGDKAIEKAQKALAAAEQAVTDAQARRAALPAASTDEGLPCPGCGVFLCAGTVDGKPALREAETLGDAEIKKRRKAIAEHDGEVSRLQGEVGTCRRALAELSDARTAAQTAAQTLSQAGDAAATSDAAISQARRELAAAEERLAAYRAWVTAASLHTQIVRTLGLAEALGPLGLRKIKLEKALAPFNEELAELCAVAGWRPVRIDEALDVYLGADPYWLLSESAQFRVRVTLAAVMARTDKSDAMLIDGADVLDARGRNGLFAMLQAVGVPALVAMTINKPALVPALDAAGLGYSYWLDDGVTKPIRGGEPKS